MVKTKGRPKKDRPDPPKRAPRQKQGYLDPDLAPVSIPEIDDLAERYVSARDARMAMTLTETEAATQLLAELQSRHMTEYEYDGKLVKAVTLVKVKVNKCKDAEGEKGGDDQ